MKNEDLQNTLNKQTLTQEDRNNLIRHYAQQTLPVMTVGAVAQQLIGTILGVAIVLVIKAKQ